MSFRDALNNPEDELNNFDAAGGGDDLAAFDAATGETHIPAGNYVCTVANGELTLTKQGKSAYRLALNVAAGPHHGFRLWRYFTFGTPGAANYAKKVLVPLGLRTVADLRRRPFPEAGRVITVNALVTIDDNPQYGTRNSIERFVVTDDRRSVPNPNEVDPDAPADGGAP